MWRQFMEVAAGWNSAAIVIRLVFAVIVGLIVGIDRGMKRRGAGIKTHTLVCLGAAIVMLTGQYIYENFEGNMDMSRMGAQVISGVGFLGVGTIIVTGRNQVRGLTTAAGLWACACVGLAIGIGFVEGAVVTVILFIITLKLLAKIDILMHHYAKVTDVYIEFQSNKGVTIFIEEMRKKDVKISTLEMGKSRVKGEGPTAIVTIEVKNRHLRSQTVAEIGEMEVVRFVEEL